MSVLSGASSPLVGAAQFGLGGYQAYSANKALKQLSKQGIPQFNITPEQTTSYNRAGEMARTGFTGSERAAVNQGLARGSNAAYRRALDLGGGSTARGIMGALGAQNLAGQNQLAGMDAGLKRRNIQYADQVGRGITDQRNRETQRAYNYRMLLEQNLGLAKKIGLENIVNSMAYLGSGMSADQSMPTWGGGQQGLPQYPQPDQTGQPTGTNSQFNYESNYTSPFDTGYQGGFKVR